MEWSPILAYLLALGVLTGLGAPIAALLFRSVPGRGAAFALPTALVPFTIVVFWIGQITFGLHTLLVGVAVLVVGSLAARRLGADPDWRAVVGMYGVFTVGFLIMVAFRGADPGLTPAGGEQFLHFGLVNAIERANSLPPQDMWYAGEPLKYYYGTQLQVTSLSMLTGTPLRYGFNLGIATFYGLLFVVAYGVGGAILQRRGYSHRLGGVFGAFFVALAGHTTTAIRLVTPHLPDAIGDPIEPAAFGFVAGRFKGGNLTQAVQDLSAPLEWGWWYTRYVIPDTLHEVPLYSFVKADLHGHALANGYVLFCGALALAYYVTPKEARVRRLAIIFGGLGAVAGVFGFMNTWSFPTAAGMAVLAVGAADPHPATLLPDRWANRLVPSDRASVGDGLRWLGQETWRLALAGLVGVVVLLIGVVIASPFLVFGQVPTNDGIGFLPPRSALGPFLVVYGGLITLFALYVGHRGWPAVADRSKGVLAIGALGLFAAMVVTTLILKFGVLAVLGPPIIAGWLLVRTDRAGFATVLLVAGAGLLLALELVHARLPLVDMPRWNTTLKVAVQGWTLGAAGAGAAAATLLVRSRDRVAAYLQRNTGADTEADAGADVDATVDESIGQVAALRSAATLALVVLVVLASAVFPFMVFGSEIGAEVAEDRYTSSLDGLNYAERFHGDEFEALQWLTDRQGHPVLVEAPGGQYQWTSPAATFSGLPGVIGWDHEAEYRSQAAYNRRVNHVDKIFSGEWSDAVRYLDRYDVTYVYVGPNERSRYGAELRSFQHEAFSVAFEEDGVTIYRVDQSALPDVGG